MVFHHLGRCELAPSARSSGVFAGPPFSDFTRWGEDEKRIAGYLFIHTVEKEVALVSIYSMARISRLNRLELQLAEVHARRGDERSQRRQVRDAPPVTWLPEGTEGDPLALEARYTDHIAGAFVPAGRGKALHLLVKFPEAVPVTTREEAEAALKLAVHFAQVTFGGEAVFAARMDRDEKSFTNADLFLAPRYTKRTKRTEKVAISLSRHLKQLAEKHGGLPEDKDILRRQGQVLQDAFAQFLRAQGYQALRGQPKKTKSPDWTSPEAFGARADRAIAEADREVAAEIYAAATAEHSAVEQQRSAIAREREQLDRNRSMLTDERASIEQALDDTERARGQLLDAANTRARGIVADAEDQARRLRDRTAEEVRQTIADSKAVAQQRAQQTLEREERIFSEAMDTANRIKAAAQAEADERAQALDQRQRAVEALEQHTLKAALVAQAATDRAQADVRTAHKLRCDASAINEDARQRRDAAEQARRDTTVAAAQIALVARSVGDEALNPFPGPGAPSGLDIDETAMTADERLTYRSPWSDLSRAVARAIGVALEKLADLKRAAERMMKQAKEEKAAVDRDRAELCQAERKLTADRDILMQDRRQLEKHRGLAAAFVEAYEAVPNADRTTRVAAALKSGGVLVQATSLSPRPAVASTGPTKVDEAQPQPITRNGAER